MVYELEAVSEGEILKGVQQIVCPNDKFVLYVNPQFLRMAVIRTEAKPYNENTFFASRYNLYIEQDEDIKVAILKKV